MLVNHWLPYQVLASRYWARSGFHQSEALRVPRPAPGPGLLSIAPGCVETPAAAARQFPKATSSTGGIRRPGACGRGFRRLPLAAVRRRAYVDSPATPVLDEEVPFLHGRRLAPAVVYERRVADQCASLYRHCELAIRNGLRFGTHGLPLIGCGDWNDGMNRIGREGRGESVWLGFFLFDVLTRFAPLAERRGDAAFARQCRRAADQLRDSIEAYARTAAGTCGHSRTTARRSDRAPPPSAASTAAQSWAAQRAAASDGHRGARRGACRTGRRGHGIVRIFKPPFDRSGDPGYIKGYVPGVRENGGQYTHAAVWAAMAVAKLGRAAEAWRLLHMLSPIAHSDTPEKVARYRGEPYVMPADVYSAKGHEGRAGWTWYTGSAGWLYQLLVRQLLGLNIEADRLRLAPLCRPAGTSSRCTTATETFYHIRVVKTGEESCCRAARPRRRPRTAGPPSCWLTTARAAR